MKKIILAWIIAVTACLAFADGKEEPKLRHYPVSYMKKAEDLEAKENYIEAVKTLRKGLGKVDNKCLNSRIFYVHGKIIELFLKAKRVDLAVKELDYLFSLADRRDLIVSDLTVDCIYDAVVHGCKRIKDDKITSKYYQKIIDVRKRSLEKALKQHSYDDISDCYRNTIRILRDAGRYDEAIKTANAAIRYNKKNLSEDILLDEINYMLLADIFVAKQEYAAAIKTYKEFLQLSKKENDKTRDINIHFSIVQIYIKSKNFHSAERELEIIIRLTENLKGDDIEYKRMNFQSIGMKYMEIGKYKLALSFLKKALMFTKEPFFIKLINDDIKLVEQKIEKE